MVCTSLPHQAAMKLIVKLLVLLFLGLAAMGVAGYILVPPAAKSAVDTGSRYAFGVPATVGEISASPGLSRTSIGFSSYVLSSPAGFEDPLLSIGRFQVGVGTTSLVSDVKNVGTLALEDVTLTLSQRGTSNNIVPVLQHLRGLGGEAGGAPPPSGEEAAGSDADGAPGPRLRIGTIRVAGIAARLQLSDIPGLESYDETFEIPAYEEDWSDVTGEDGKTVSEIAGLVLEGLEARALDAADGVVPGPVLEALRQTLSGGLEGGLDAAGAALQSEAERQLGGLEEEGKARLDDELEKAGGDATKQLKGLLGGDRK